jgi:hypothetical protein
MKIKAAEKSIPADKLLKNVFASLCPQCRTEISRGLVIAKSLERLQEPS